MYLKLVFPNRLAIPKTECGGERCGNCASGIPDKTFIGNQSAGGPPAVRWVAAIINLEWKEIDDESR